jgi:DNA-binding beta-propeller fold protein YncE
MRHEPTNRRAPWRLGLILLVAALAPTPTARAQDDPGEAGRPASRRGVVWPGMTSTGQVLLPNGWKLRPAGRQVALGDFPIALAEHPEAPVLAALHAGYGEHEVVTLDTRTGKIIARATVPETYGGLAWSPDGSRLYVGGGFDDVIYRFAHKDGYLGERATFTLAAADAAARSNRDEPLVRAERGARRPQGAIAGLALSRDGAVLWAANAFAHRLERLDAESGTLAAEVLLPEDSYPYAVALDEPRGRAYVSLWGASKVAVVDMNTNELVATWDTGPHPNEMLLAPGGAVLYVANANHNTVTVHDLARDGKALATIGTAIDPNAPAGCTPNSLALSPDGAALFVANADTNDVAVVNVKDPARSTPLGFIPAGWYPTSVRVSRDGRTLWIANGKGATSSPNREGPNPFTPRGESALRQYIGGLFRGTLSIVPMPAPARMAEYSRTVYACSPVRRGDPTAVAGADDHPDNPIPGKLGDPSPIKYCVYIIKENRTYDQVFGDMPEGNGAPELCLFPERVTPNHHALARAFVLLDNFYVESEVSADGHEWTMGAYATDFVERTWPLSYRGDRRVPYPAEGNFAIARPAGGYLWDRAKAKGITYRSYGEFVDDGKTNEPALVGHFHPTFPSYNLDIPDQRRADIFLEELREFEAQGEMPQLSIVRLPNDHTSGTSPGKPTVTAMVADNDLALGRVVEGLSRSRFWPRMAIFVVEDDAQNGSDHVDAHRTVALAISPYIRRGSVDSTLYTTASMLRTMELILGLEPMSQFDAAARPMFASFTNEPDLTPYETLPPNVDLRELNTRDAPGADLSMKLDLTKEDRADDLVFNEIIWKAVKGADSVMPPPVRAAFVLPRSEPDGDDDDD